MDYYDIMDKLAVFDFYKIEIDSKTSGLDVFSSVESTTDYILKNQEEIINESKIDPTIYVTRLNKEDTEDAIKYINYFCKLNITNLKSDLVNMKNWSFFEKPYSYRNEVCYQFVEYWEDKKTIYSNNC